MDDRHVGLRQVKERLSAYVAEVQQGESLVITVHGQPAARLVDDLLDEMADEGLIDRATAPRGAWRFTSPPVAVPAGISLSRTVIDDRR
jgi:prevent-host-death family protein